MRLKRSGRLAVLGLALCIPTLGLSGCAGQPGAAAFGKGFSVSEDAVSQVSSDLAKVNPEITRANVLGDLMLLDNGGRQALKEGNCPGNEQVQDLFRLSPEQYQQMSPLTHDWLRLRLCTLGMNPQQAMQLVQLGVEPLNPQTQQLLNQANTRLQDDTSIQISPRYQQALAAANPG